MSYPFYSLLILPYVRAELPGWGHLYRWFGGRVSDGDMRWEYAPKKVIRGKWHRYLMPLDLSNWSQRLTYFLGRYYELGVQLVLTKLLQPGDRFVDIGANLGMISLHAASLVTDTGSVESFEPNPDCVQAVRETMQMNAIDHVTIHAMGLSDAPAVLNLNFSSAHTGTATLCTTSETIRSIPVPVKVGDDMLLGNTKPVDVIKIDVEGFEFHVLRGLQQVLRRDRPVIVMEFVEKHFLRENTSCDAIAAYLVDLGYRCYGISTPKKALGHHLRLHPVINNYAHSGSTDVVWVHEGDARRKVIESFAVTN